MLKTLYWYLSRELLRVTLLATVAFTLVMTVFAIIEPLRKRGLETAQVAMLFVYTTPVMLSLTLPFAALFAAVIVYGRFAQEREMLACRASGISTMTLMKPALFLGVIITVISMTLTNFVAPEMARRGEKAVVENIEKIVTHKIQKQGHFKLKNLIVHASKVIDIEDLAPGQAEQDGNGNQLMTGVVIAQLKNHKLQAFLAGTARFRIEDTPTGKCLIPAATDWVGPITNSTSVRISGKSLTEQSVADLLEEGILIEDIARDKPAFYTWDQMVRTLQDPTRHGEIRRGMENIVRVIRYNRFLHDVADTLRGGKFYKKFRTDTTEYAIYAPVVTVSGHRATLRADEDANGKPRLVVLRETAAGGSKRSYSARTGRIEVDYNALTRVAQVTIELIGDVQATNVSGETPRSESMPRAQIPLPAEDGGELQAADVYRNPKDYTQDPVLLKQIEALRNDRERKIIGDIHAEMHARIAFGLCCMLLVAMGAALGVIFKGGQVLSAFAITVVPATGMIILILMGKKMISNPKSSDLAGMIAIWGGLAAMLVGNMVIYHRLSKK